MKRSLTTERRLSFVVPGVRRHDAHTSVTVFDDLGQPLEVFLLRKRKTLIKNASQMASSKP